MSFKVLDAFVQSASQSSVSLRFGVLFLCGAARPSLGSVGLARLWLSSGSVGSSLAGDEGQRGKTTGSESGQVCGASWNECEGACMLRGACGKIIVGRRVQGPATVPFALCRYDEVLIVTCV